MKKFQTVLTAVCMLVAPALFAQSDNCASFEMDDSSLRIPMEVQGRPTVAVLNTGFLPIGISTGLARNLGLDVKAVPSRNMLWSAIPVIKGQVEEVPVKVFGQDLKMEQMYVLENELPFVYLSLLMFNDFVTQINFPQKQLCFLNRQALDLRAAKNIEMRSSAGQPAVQVTVNGDKKLWLQFQLELAGAVVLDRKAAVDLGIARTETANENTAADQLASSMLDSLMFGPYELGNINVRFPLREIRPDAATQMLQTASRRSGGGVNVQGSLGREIFKHFVLTMDFKEDHMHIYVP